MLDFRIACSKYGLYNMYSILENILNRIKSKFNCDQIGIATFVHFNSID